ncbi:hypothetical protein BGZ60DRAFT_567888 [Tricladium varicosporioides]|nr:hypothetical protein BGZ60DRAFT_567888 [Hymenoscyphus varicosporioides]
MVMDLKVDSLRWQTEKTKYLKIHNLNVEASTQSAGTYKPYGTSSAVPDDISESRNQGINEDQRFQQDNQTCIEALSLKSRDNIDTRNIISSYTDGATASYPKSNYHSYSEDVYNTGYSDHAVEPKPPQFYAGGNLECNRRTSERIIHKTLMKVKSVIKDRTTPNKILAILKKQDDLDLQEQERHDEEEARISTLRSADQQLASQQETLRHAKYLAIRDRTLSGLIENT